MSQCVCSVRECVSQCMCSVGECVSQCVCSVRECVAVRVFSEGVCRSACVQWGSVCRSACVQWGSVSQCVCSVGECVSQCMCSVGECVSQCVCSVRECVSQCMCSVGECVSQCVDRGRQHLAVRRKPRSLRADEPCATRLPRSDGVDGRRHQEPARRGEWERTASPAAAATGGDKGGRSPRVSGGWSPAMHLPTSEVIGKYSNWINKCGVIGKISIK